MGIADKYSLSLCLYEIRIYLFGLFTFAKLPDNSINLFESFWRGVLTSLRKYYLKWTKFENFLLRSNKVSIDETLFWMDYSGDLLLKGFCYNVIILQSDMQITHFVIIQTSKVNFLKCKYYFKFCKLRKAWSLLDQKFGGRLFPPTYTCHGGQGEMTRCVF